MVLLVNAKRENQIINKSLSKNSEKKRRVCVQSVGKLE